MWQTILKKRASRPTEDVCNDEHGLHLKHPWNIIVAQCSGRQTKLMTPAIVKHKKTLGRRLYSFRKIRRSIARLFNYSFQA